MHVCTREECVDIRTVAGHQAIIPNNGIIYWHINEQYVTSDLDKLKLVVAFQKAFAEWQPYFIPLKFEATSDKSKAAIVIHFMHPGDAALPDEFGSTTLAYAYFPNRESLGIHGDMYFNDQYKWAEKHGPDSLNLFKVIVHELGHAFGLHHSTDVRDIMYPTYQPNDEVILTPDTLQGIKTLYGTPKAELKLEAVLKRFLQDMFKHKRDIANNRQLQLLADILGVPFYRYAVDTTATQVIAAIRAL